MHNQASARAAQDEPRSAPAPARVPDYPVREYIGAMAQELAQMARWDGDEALAVMLEAAMDRASTALQRPVVAPDPAPSALRPT